MKSMDIIVPGHKNIPRDSVKYKLSKVHKCWVRTWFTIEKDENGSSYFKQRNAFSLDRNAAWDKWNFQPPLDKEKQNVSTSKV